MNRLAGFAFIVLLVCGVFSCQNGEEDADEQFVYSSPEETGFSIPADFLGMVHASAVSETENALLDDYGVKWMLTDFSWGSIQPESKKDAAPENWNWSDFDTYVAAANAKGKKILAILDYDVAWLHGGWSDAYVEMTDSVNGGRVNIRKYADGCTDRSIVGEAERAKFCAYAAATVARYNGENGHGKVDAWCIWNEPNLCPRFWTAAPEEFFRLTKAAASAIRQADPDAVIIGGAFMTMVKPEWYPAILTWRDTDNKGAMEQVDFIAYHPYMPNPSASANMYTGFNNTAAAGGFHNKVWVTEVCYPTTPEGGYGTEIAEEKMPEAVMKTLTLLTAGKAAHVFWYQLRDPNNEAKTAPYDAEDWFGLLKHDDSPKGGAYSYKFFANNIPGKTWRTQYPMRSTKLPKYFKAYYFEDDGKHALILWSEVAPLRIKVTLPGRERQLWDLADGTASPIEETTAYTLRDGLNQNVKCFTWENSDRSKPPRISAN